MTIDTSALAHSMCKYNAILAGPQATSFFYLVLTDITSAPWDFFYPTSNMADFLNEFSRCSSAITMDAISTSLGQKIFTLKKNMGKGSGGCSIHIISCTQGSPVSNVLSYRASYNQSYLNPFGCMCFWPMLQKPNLYRNLEANSGHNHLPSPGVRPSQSSLRPSKPATLRNPIDNPKMYSVSDGRCK